MLLRLDASIITTLRRNDILVSRIALFVVYGWFGFLKVIGESPASPLVNALETRMLPFIDAGHFLVAFGVID